MLPVVELMILLMFSRYIFKAFMHLHELVCLPVVSYGFLMCLGDVEPAGRYLSGRRRNKSGYSHLNDGLRHCAADAKHVISSERVVKMGPFFT